MNNKLNIQGKRKDDLLEDALSDPFFQNIGKPKPRKLTPEERERLQESYDSSNNQDETIEDYDSQISKYNPSTEYSPSHKKELRKQKEEDRTLKDVITENSYNPDKLKTRNLEKFYQDLLDKFIQMDPEDEDKKKIILPRDSSAAA